MYSLLVSVETIVLLYELVLHIVDCLYTVAVMLKTILLINRYLNGINFKLITRVYNNITHE